MTMTPNPHRHRGFTLAALVLLTALLSGCGAPATDTVTVHRGTLVESFIEDGETHLEFPHLVTAPVAGRIKALALKPGDHLNAGDILFRYDEQPLKSALDEARGSVEEFRSRLSVSRYDKLEDTLRETAGREVDAMREVVRASEAQREAQAMRRERADKELHRQRELHAAGGVSQATLDDATLDAETARMELSERDFTLAATRALLAAFELGPRLIDEWVGRKRLNESVLTSQFVQAEARLIKAEYEMEFTEVRAEGDRIVLERYENGEQTVSPGQPILLLGRLDDIDVRVDTLTEDALRLRIGGPAIIRFFPDGEPVTGVVERIDPAGFTKLSSLGVEQQRVAVIVRPTGNLPDNTGTGFQASVRFETARSEEALIVPRFSVLQDAGGEHFVYVVEGSRIKRQAVETGLRNDHEMEIPSGLEEGDRLISVPDATMLDGMRVKALE